MSTTWTIQDLERRAEAAAAEAPEAEAPGIRDSEGNKLGLLCDVAELGVAGAGVELYFRTLRSVVGLLVLATLLGVPAMASNVSVFARSGGLPSRTGRALSEDIGYEPLELSRHRAPGVEKDLVPLNGDRDQWSLVPPNVGADQSMDDLDQWLEETRREHDQLRHDQNQWREETQRAHDQRRQEWEKEHSDSVAPIEPWTPSSMYNQIASLPREFARSFAPGTFEAAEGWFEVLPVVASLGQWSMHSRGQVLTSHAVPSLLFTLFALAFLYYVHRRRFTVARAVDLRYVTAGDYAVLVTELPHDRCETAGLADFFAQFGPVAHVEVIRNVTEYVPLESEWDKLARTRPHTLSTYVSAYHSAVRAQAAHDAKVAAGEEVRGLLPRDPEAVLAEAQRYEATTVERLEELEAEMAALKAADEFAPTGDAIVVFDRADARARCLHAGGIRQYAPAREFLRSLLGRAAPKPSSAGDGGALGLGIDAEHRAYVAPAPEPSELRWGQFSVDVATTGRRTLVTFGSVLLLLLVTTTALVVDELFEAQTQVGLVISVIAITAMSNVLGFAVPRLVEWEGRNTYSEEEETLFAKESIALVINDVLLLLLVSPDTAGWFALDGPMSEAFWIVGTKAVVATLSRLVLPRARLHGALCNLPGPPETSMAGLYAEMLGSVAMAIVYGPALPLVYPLAALELGLGYLLTKEAMLHVFKQVPVSDDRVAVIFTAAFAAALLASNVLQFVLYGAFRNWAASWAPLVGALAVGAYLVVPVPVLLRALSSAVRTLTCRPDFDVSAMEFHRYVDSDEDTDGLRYTEQPSLARCASRGTLLVGPCSFARARWLVVRPATLHRSTRACHAAFPPHRAPTPRAAHRARRYVSPHRRPVPTLAKSGEKAPQEAEMPLTSETQGFGHHPDEKEGGVTGCGCAVQ